MEQAIRLLEHKKGEIKMLVIKNVTFKVVGVTFNNENGSSRKAYIGQMDKESKVVLLREPKNKHDKNAIAVYWMKAPLEAYQIGYIGKQYAEMIAPELDDGKELTAEIVGVGIHKEKPYCKVVVNEVA